MNVEKALSGSKSAGFQRFYDFRNNGIVETGVCVYVNSVLSPAGQPYFGGGGVA